MRLIHYWLCILLLWSTPSWAVPLEQIEEILNLRLGQVQQPHTPPQPATLPDSSDESRKEQFSSPQKSNDPLSLQLDQNPLSTEHLEHPFSVQVGSSRSVELCYRVAVMLKRSGYQAFISSLTLPGRGTWHRVFIGALATRDAAQNIKDHLLSQDIVEGFIRHLPYAVQVGSSGNYQQLLPLYQKLLSVSLLPYSTPILNASSGKIEGRLLLGACYKRADCDLLLSTVKGGGFSAVIVER